MDQPAERGRRLGVITGIGQASALGIGVDALWSAMCEGRTGLGPIARFDASGFRCGFAGESPPYDLREWVPKSYRKATKVMVRDTELAVIAAKLACADAGLRTRAAEGEEEGAGTPIDLRRLGCMIGAGLIAADTTELTSALVTALDDDGRVSMRRWGTLTDPEAILAWERGSAWTGARASEGGGVRTEVRVGAGGMNNLPPLWMLKYLPNMLACHVTIIHGAQGPSNTHTAAEVSGLLSVGEALRVVQRGDADACFAGGAESKVCLMGLLRWDLAGRLADTRGRGITSALDALRPYDPSSAGGLLGDAGGLVVVESESHAMSRGAPRRYARVLGFGAGQDPGPVRYGARPPDHAGSDRGLVNAIRAALREAGIDPESDGVDAVVPTALGVPGEDAAELASLREVFGVRMDAIPLVPITTYVGNSVAGLGALQVATAALMLHHQRVPARLHTGRAVRADVGPAPSQARPLGRVLVCATSLGGQSAAVVLGRADGLS